jgi:putative RecB family exonuclease
VWAALCAAEPALPGALFPGGAEDPGLAAWLGSAGALVEAWFACEDPRRVEPEARELLVEVELPSGLPLRGYVDRLDTTPEGRMRVVDYKTGSPPPESGEARALFPMKFYSLALMLLRGRAPEEVRLVYLGGGEVWSYRPEAGELRRFAATLEALWAAVREAGATGEFHPSPSRSCEWCAHRVRCPAWGGTPPPYPGWPGEEGSAA